MVRRFSIGTSLGADGVPEQLVVIFEVVERSTS
jgi:hypothetical protein